MVFVYGMSFCQDSSRKRGLKRAPMLQDTSGIELENRSAACTAHDLHDWRSGDRKRSMKLVKFESDFSLVTLPQWVGHANFGSRGSDK